MKPSEVTAFSGKKVWWVCDLGHEWEESIANRAKGRGCPICSGHRVLAGFNDLATFSPDVVSEWNYEKNNGLKPEDFTCGSNRRVWWKCIRGHEWEAVIAGRVSGTGCPICASNGSSMPEQGIAFYLSKIYTIEQRKKVSGVEIDIFIPDYNVGIEYDGIFFHSSEAAKRRESNKDSVITKHGIYIIHIKESEKKGVFDNLISYVPDRMGSNYMEMIKTLILLLEGITGVKRSVSIDTERDMMLIRERFALVSKANSIIETDKDLVDEWDYVKNGSLSPEMFSSGSHQKVWWKGKCGHNWRSSISNRVKGNGCPYCAGQKVLVGFNDLPSLYPDITEEWNYDRNGNDMPSQFTAYSGKDVWWKCEKGHEWKASIHARTGRDNGCPYCSGRRTLSGFNDLLTTNPALVKEWDYEKNTISPDSVSIGSGVSVWWKCKKGHNWKTKVASRGRGSGCPYCAGQKVLIGFNDLTTTNPELLDEWDYSKNTGIKPTNITAGCNRKVWWKCAMGHEWQASINHRTRCRGCPFCSAKIGAQKAKRTRLSNKGSLFDTNPELIEEWNYQKNKDLDPNNFMAGSHVKVWWKCSLGHEWQAVIGSRTGKAKHGCPVCNHKRGGEKSMRKVMNIDTGDVYACVKQAAESCNLSSSSIVNACKGLSKTAGGYHWKYAEEKILN